MLPASGAYTLANATAPLSVLGEAGGGVRRIDIDVADGRVAAIREAGTSPPGPGHDLDGGLVLPALVDAHTHLDKGHIWPRRANPDGTWAGALTAVMEDRERRWASGDVERRFEFALRCAYAHGTAAIRTHLDSTPAQYETSWALFETMRERWAGRIALQGVALIPPDDVMNLAALDAIARRARAAGGLLGGAVHSHPGSKAIMLRLVETAGAVGLDLDLHCDECGDPASSALLHLAEAVIETGYRGRVTAGHCCALAVQEEAVAMTTIERVAAAGIAVISLPMCNMYLQDRAGARTPRWRGVTLVRELRAAGVPVALASDNTRDPFYAYGDLDMLEVFREGARILHYDHPQSEAWQWAQQVSAVPAGIAGFAGHGTIAVGAPVDLVLFRARSWTELMARPQSDRIVVRAGRPIDTSLPDYRELDDLME